MNKDRGREKTTTIMTYLCLIIFSLYVLGPLVWAVSTSLKDARSIYSYPPKLIPSPLYLKNFYGKIFVFKCTRYLLNSLIVALGAIFLAEIVAFIAAYSVARFDYKGKDLIVFLLWATIMVPGVSIIVPLYMITVRVGLYDTYVALIAVYAAWLTPTMIWLFRGFIANIPPELEESAILDGCSRWQAILYVVVPLSRPALAASAVLGFLVVWNDFLWAYALTISDTRRTVQAGLYHMMTDMGREWGPMMAATLTALVPIIVIYVILQKSFIQGLMAGSMKG